MCEHFKVLPTDERFKALSDLQVGLLFGNWLHSMPEELVWKEYWKHQTPKTLPPDPDDLSGLGYTPEQIEEILKELGNE